MNHYDTYSDEQLITMLATNDEASFNELYGRYWDKLLAVALHRTGDASDAKEIVQTVFFKLWKKRASIHLEYSLNTYLSTAVKYETINLLAERARRLKLNNSSSQHLSLHTQHELDFRELQRIVHEKVKTLPEKCRIIYELSRNEGLSNKDIAAKLQLSEKTVENQITIALRKLKSGIPGAASIIFLLH